MDAKTIGLLLAAASAAQGIGQSISNSKDRKSTEALTKEELAQREEEDRRATALSESLQNPFRHQMDQAHAISGLDRLERSTYSPVTVAPASRYAGYVPKTSGGASYEKSPELVQSAAALKRNVMGGNVAPTMTNPGNYGRTGALDLLSIAADGADPGTVNGGRTGAVPRPGATGVGVNGATGATDPLAGIGRRGGGTGGVARGAMAGLGTAGAIAPYTGPAAPFVLAGGAVVGAIAGAIGKHAKTAPTDLTVADATGVLGNVMRTELGREPRPGEIEGMLAGQGLQPGQRFVGEQGLRALIQTLRSQGGQMAPSYSAVA